MRATGSFDVTRWDEETYEEREGGKLTRASVTQTFTGDIDAEGAVEWLMSYGDDGTAHFVGLQRVRGAIGDQKGSCVLETSGEFDGKVAKGSWTVVAGSGSGALSGITGGGRFEAPVGGTPTYELDYQFT